MPTQVKLIEFTGLPGSGKTTLTRATADRLRRNGIACACFEELVKDEFSAYKKMNRVQKLLRYCASSPEGLRGLFEALVFGLSIRPLRKHHIGRVFYCLDLIYMFGIAMKKASQAGCRFILVDQGLIQATWSSLLRAAAPDARSLDRLFGFYGKCLGRCVVFLGVEVDTALARIKHRELLGEPRLFKNADEKAARKSLTDSRQHLEDLTAGAVRSSGAVYLQLDGGLGIAENAGKIADFVHSSVEQGRLS